MHEISQMLKRLETFYLSEFIRHLTVIEACHITGQPAPISRDACDHALMALKALWRAESDYRPPLEWALSQSDPKAAHARVMAKLQSLLQQMEAAQDAVDAHVPMSPEWAAAWDEADKAGDKALSAVLACVILMDRIAGGAA